MGRWVGAVGCVVVIAFIAGIVTHSIRVSTGAGLALLGLGALMKALGERSSVKQKTYYRYLHPRGWLTWIMNTRDPQSFADRVTRAIEEFQKWEAMPHISGDLLLNYCVIQLEEARIQAEGAAQGWYSFDALQRTQIMDGLRSKTQIAIQEIDSGSWTASNQYTGYTGYSWPVRPYYCSTWTETEDSNPGRNWHLLPIGLLLLICAVFISWPVLAEFGAGPKPPPPPKVVCKKCKSLNDPFLVGKLRTHCGICGERL